MDKQNPNSRNIVLIKDKYGWIQHSAVSWRRKSSYRKPIKRWASKMARRGSKNLTRLNPEDE